MRHFDIRTGGSEKSAELRELGKRNRLSGQENEVLRKTVAYLSQNNPSGK